jgi:hypothetical protein
MKNPSRIRHQWGSEMKAEPRKVDPEEREIRGMELKKDRRAPSRQ